MKLDDKTLRKYTCRLAKVLERHWKGARRGNQQDRKAYEADVVALFALLRLPQNNPQVIVGVCHAGALVEPLNKQVPGFTQEECMHFAPLVMYAIHYSDEPI